MIGGYFLFKERFTKGAVIGCLIAISGSIIIGWQDFKISGEALYGDILAFIAAGIITAYFFISQHVRKDLSLIPYSVISYGSSAGFLGIFAFMQQESFIHYSTQTWLCFIGLAFIATILGQTIFNWLLKWMSATVISMSILGETIGTCMLAYFILHETISLQQGLGITVIFIGLVLFLLQPNSNEKA
ncbi:Permeases of the drug/metabolite transporter(DMT) superfamily [Streptococcus pneumoniae]|nr:Permeases of the drug/metabolite transporter(DMT) superfamily [Streptococcus pneumoniae]CRG03012.1 Permeases of the drug/metabolite transporter(DMT) superfamily [Streptococcus pneumoniae]